MHEEDQKAASDPKHVKKIEKVAKKLAKLEAEQPSHKLGQFLGIPFSECNYTCASQCFSNAPLMGKLKESPAIDCVIYQCQCSKVDVPFFDEEEDEESQLFIEQLQHEMSLSESVENGHVEYIQQARPRGYNLYERCDPSCGKDCLSAFKKKGTWEVADLCLKQRCDCYFNNNTIEEEEAKQHLLEVAAAQAVVSKRNRLTEPSIVEHAAAAAQEEEVDESGLSAPHIISS